MFKKSITFNAGLNPTFFMHGAIKIFTTALLLLLVAFPARVLAQKHSSYHTTYTGSRGGHYHYSSSGKKVYEKNSTGTTKDYFKKSSVSSTGSTHSDYSNGAKRDKHGRIKRSSSARHSFMKMTGYPHGRPGYIVDHIIPLKKGGCDCPSNMQWQTISAAKEKDKWEAP